LTSPTDIFATKRRTFIVADTPGREQYTRNMATGASGSELAVLLVDARKGVLGQTRRHAIIASLLGIRYAVLVVNKIDLNAGAPSITKPLAARAIPRIQATAPRCQPSLLVQGRSRASVCDIAPARR
jgi:selenocysteine-specific translation elongation factor